MDMTSGTWASSPRKSGFPASQITCFNLPQPPQFGDGWSKDRWGPVAWRYIHELAIRYPAQPSARHQHQALGALLALVRRLPCYECRAHAGDYVRDNPPQLESGARFQTWAWRFHNFVNARLGKPHFTSEQYLARYREEILHARQLRCL